MKKNVFLLATLAIVLAFSMALVGCADSSGNNGGNIEEDLDPPIYYDSYNGLVLAGYNGWFNAEGDGARREWFHYGFDGDGRITVDFWPDMTEYTKKYVSPYKMPDGSNAYLYSSFDEESIDLHFRWMKEYGIDGVIIQRFVTDISYEEGKQHNNKVLQSALKAARKYNRAIGIQYDLSGRESQDMKILEDDWKDLQTRFSLLDREKNPTYIHHNGYPLLSIWGVGFTERNYTINDVQQLITRIKNNYNVSMMLGVPYWWRELENDAENNPALHTLIKNDIDIVIPWAVGRYDNDSYALAKQLDGDLQWCRQNNIDYVTVVFPGFSWGNLMRDTTIYNAIPRLRGDFLWKQIAGAKSSGASSLYVAMFDEIDEGTAIYKCAEEGNLPIIGDGRRFVGIETGLGSDYYLWLVGEATKWFHGAEGYSATKPVR